MGARGRWERLARACCSGPWPACLRCGRNAAVQPVHCGSGL